jgi:2-methylcitrate dehydratase PrpD
VVWSAVSACALEQDATWSEAVTAAVLGYELVVRLAEGLSPEHRRHWHVTTTAGIVGAAAAAARLLGVDDDSVVDAVGHATSVASGSAQAQFERTGTRLVHRAFAASTGVGCARAACAGLKGNRYGLEGGRGAFATGAPALAKTLLRDGASTGIEETGFRLHPANGFAHAAIDAALLMGPIVPDAIAHVTVTVSPPAAVTLASNPVPASDDDAWWSIEHAVAISLATNSTDALASGLTDRDDVLRLCRRTDVVAEEAGWGATLEMTMRDGEVKAASTDTPLGHGSRPATDDDLCAKWQRLTGDDGSPFLDRLLTAPPQASFASILDAGVGVYAGPITRAGTSSQDKPRGSKRGSKRR